MTSERLKRLLPITRGTSPELEARKVYLTHQELGGTFLSVPDRKDAVVGGSNVIKDTPSASTGSHRWLRYGLSPTK